MFATHASDQDGELGEIACDDNFVPGGVVGAEGRQTVRELGAEVA